MPIGWSIASGLSSRPGAGFTAMLAVMALEDHGLNRSRPCLVTGAGALDLLRRLTNLEYEVAAVTGRPETERYAPLVPPKSCHGKRSTKPLTR